MWILIQFHLLQFETNYQKFGAAHYIIINLQYIIYIDKKLITIEKNYVHILVNLIPKSQINFVPYFRF